MFNETTSVSESAEIQPVDGGNGVDKLKLLKIQLNSGLLFQVNTPVVSDLAITISDWIEAGLQGAIVYGEPRLGKTAGVKWALKQIPFLLGCEVHHYMVPMRHSTSGTEGQFFEYLLKASSHRYPSSGNTTVKRCRYTDLLCGSASQSPMKKVVVAFDEAQTLQNQHYDWMLDVSNEMAAKGFGLFFLQVGQTELHERIKQFGDAKKNQIVTRFMSDSMKFRGLNSPGEVQEVLSNLNETV